MPTCLGSALPQPSGRAPRAHPSHLHLLVASSRPPKLLLHPLVFEGPNSSCQASSAHQLLRHVPPLAAILVLNPATPTRSDATAELPYSTSLLSPHHGGVSHLRVHSS